MKRMRLAMVGLGRLGRACGETILQAQDLQLAGVVRRRESLLQPLPEIFRGAAASAEVETLAAVDAALLCLPPAQSDGALHDLLQHGIPVVECAVRPRPLSETAREKLHHLALRHHARAILGAGWEPGALDLFQSLFTVLIPKGHTERTNRPGVSLHHTLSARAADGVADALCTELPSADGTTRRYVYVELLPGADADRVTATIAAEPLFLDEETVVLPVESIAALEEEDAGIVLERGGRAGGAGHQRMLFESRFDRAALAAQVMVAAARALPQVKPGVHDLADIPLSLLRHAGGE